MALAIPAYKLGCVVGFNQMTYKTQRTEMQSVLFRLVSTELLEGDFNTCANTKRDNTKGDTKLPKRALLGEKQDKHLSR